MKTHRKSLSSKANSGVGGCVLILFCSVFFLMGSGFLFFIFINPVLKMQKAKTWQEAPCTIVSSKVQSRRNSDGDNTYSIEIKYSYEVNGVKYTSDRYGFLDMSSSGKLSKQKVVSAYKSGSQKKCYVNPKDPHDAVLNKGMQKGMWFGLLPLLFVVIGLAGIAGGLRTLRRKKLEAQGLGSSFMVTAPKTEAKAVVSGTLKLEPETSTIGKFLLIIFVALLWNSIVSVFLCQLASRAISHVGMLGLQE